MCLHKAIIRVLLVRSAVELNLDSWCYTNSTLEIKVNGRKAGEHAWYIILYMPILLSLKLQKRSCKNKFYFPAIISIFHSVQIEIRAEITSDWITIIKFIGSLYFNILKQISSKDFDVNCQCFWITCLSTKLFFARLLWLVHGSVKGNKQGFVAVLMTNIIFKTPHVFQPNQPNRDSLYALYYQLGLIRSNFSTWLVYHICSEVKFSIEWYEKPFCITCAPLHWHTM